MSEENVHQGYIRHAAMAQLHRWFQFYERPDKSLENQLDILSETVRLKSGLGEATGHDAYRERLKAIPETWLNAHFVGVPDFEIAENGAIGLNVGVRYLNQGMLPDGAVRVADLSYTTKLAPTETVLPKFTSIEIRENSVADENSVTNSGTFSPAYAENRLASLMHYWLAIIEDPARDPEPVREILADEFSLNFSIGGITDFEGFRDWLAGPGSQISASTYAIKNLSHEELGDNVYRLSAGLDWQGILPDGREVEANTRHVWIVVDDPSERFARIKQVDVEAIRPPRS